MLITKLCNSTIDRGSVQVDWSVRQI